MFRTMCVSVTLTLVACGGGGGDDGGGGEASSGGEAAYAGPIRSSDLELGEEQYESYCNVCHDDGAPKLDGLEWPVAKVRMQVREGTGEMSPIPASKLSDEDLEAVLAYMVTIKAVVDDETGGAEPLEDDEDEGWDDEDDEEEMDEAPPRKKRKGKRRKRRRRR